MNETQSGILELDLDQLHTPELLKRKTYREMSTIDAEIIAGQRLIRKREEFQGSIVPGTPFQIILKGRSFPIDLEALEQVL